MKTVQVIVIFTIVLGFISCERNYTDPIFPFKATVLGRNIDCGLYQIQFIDDIEEVIKLAGSSPQNIYIAENLPDSLELEGIKIILNIRNPLGSEIGPCLTFGPSLTWVHVLEAKKAD
jgi:hypothetical protein